MTHPGAADLALLAGGELPFWRRWRWKRHVKQCPDCRLELEAFRREREMVRRTRAELPPDLDWGPLAADMKANIRLAVAAGECVAPAGARARPLGWRVAAALVSLALIMISGWWLHVPRPPLVARDTVEGAVLEATSEGIELRTQDRVFTLIHASSEPVLVSVNVEGAMEARYIDDETGMVTINNVYAQ